MWECSCGHIVAGMWPLVLQASIAVSIAGISIATLLYALFDWNPWPVLVRLSKRLDPHPTRPAPSGRPIEQIAQHARRLWRRSHMPDRGLSRAKQLAIRQAYDHVLAEGCEALGLQHLLGVLPPGDELDIERERVEDLLEYAGLRLRQNS